MFLDRILGRRTTPSIAPVIQKRTTATRVAVGLVGGVPASIRSDASELAKAVPDAAASEHALAAAGNVVSLKQARQASRNTTGSGQARSDDVVRQGGADSLGPRAEHAGELDASSLMTPTKATASREMHADALPKTLTSTHDLPDYIGLASSAGTLEVNEKLRKEIAILKVDESGAFAIIITAKHFRGAYYMGLLERIQTDGGKVVFEAIADSGLIASLYVGVRSVNGSETYSSFSREFDELIATGLAINASDIHIMCRHENTDVKMRRNGTLKTTTTWSSDYTRSMARAIHAMADDDTKEPTFTEADSQGMMVSRNIDGQQIQLRVQTSPVYPGGLEIVMRILKSGSNAKPIPLAALGYAKGHIEMLEYMMRSPWGLLLFSGETGSGKSTSLFTVMTDLARGNGGLKLYTVEDPPEYNMESYGITQIPVNKRRNETGNPFNKTLRTLMRMDLDIAMVGEIRDNDSAEAVVNLVRSGHKMVSTLHASGVLAILERMRSFNVDTQTMTSRGFITGLVTQRLAPVLCTHCKTDYVVGTDLGVKGLAARIRAVTTDGDTLFTKGAGCFRCDNTGISEQTVLAEMLIPDGKMLDLLRNEKFFEAYEYWRSARQPDIADINGSMVGMTMLEHGILKMRLGLIAPDELERRVGPLTQGHEVIHELVGRETMDLLG